MRQVRLSRSAQADIEAILAWSAENFGDPARLRYAALIAAGIRDIAADPQQPGARSRPELGDGVWSWHLRLSRDRTAAGPVRGPRHFIIYRFDEARVTIGRVLHDAMELDRHAGPEATWD